jgi:hypothetical protein
MKKKCLCIKSLSYPFKSWSIQENEYYEYSCLTTFVSHEENIWYRVYSKNHREPDDEMFYGMGEDEFSKHFKDIEQIREDKLNQLLNNE